MSKEVIPYGGQAVLEGVMMRGPDQMAMAVRGPEGDIQVKKYPLSGWRKKYKVLNLPFIRGVIILFEALFLGVKTLSDSANMALGEEEEIKPIEMVLTVILGVGLALLLFVVMPAGIIRLVQNFIESNVVLNLLEGLIKVLALIGYIYALNLLPDTRRFFQNHGAEHKVLHTYEAGKELNVESVRGFSTKHPRCGTSFIFLVILLSVLFFTILFGRPTFLQRVASHMMLLPVVAGCAYEIIRAAGKPSPNPIIKLLSVPGQIMQFLTTREPSDEQIEVAITALKGILDD